MPMDEFEVECEEGCGCKFRRNDAFALKIDGMEHQFCCSDCADSYMKHLSKHTVEVLRSFVRPGYTVADIGCGNGNYTLLLAELVHPEGIVFATDSDDKKIEALKTTVGKNVIARTSPAHDTRFIRPESVDFILCNNVLCCTDRRIEVIGGFQRILRPGGVAYISTSRIPSTGVSRISDEEWNDLFQSFEQFDGDSDAGSRWVLLRKRPLKDKI
jgi:ubiquinone/menaquinone biosynthesis C-methylase UbiE